MAMGESVLRGRVGPEDGSAGAPAGAQAPCPRGKRVKIPAPGCGCGKRWRHERAQRRRRRLREELSFLVDGEAALESGYPARGLPSRQSALASSASGAPATARENLGEQRIPRPAVPITASGLQGEQPLVE